MKVEAYVLLFVGAFFGCVCLAYWLLSNETSGTAMLAGTMMLGFFPGTYYFWWSRRMKPRPEDDPQATRSDGAGIVAAFPSTSIWPFVLGLGATCVALSLVFGFWTAPIGFTLGVATLLGVVRESRRGGTV
jgi:Cytochrome c oxidase subunit IV